MQKTVIFDLDGTIALIQKRRALAAKPDGKINWKVFFDPKNISLDEPNVPIIEVFKAMKAAGYIVGIFSGRDFISRKETEDWLYSHGVNYDFFQMRAKNDYTPDDILKKDWLDMFIEDGHEILMVFDDRNKVVKMWRDNGITCVQVADGEF